MEVSDTRIGVVLTTWKRSGLLQDQLQALRNQTVPFHELVVWRNYAGGVMQPIIDNGSELMTGPNKNESMILCTKNWGVWPRFIATTFMDCEYYAVFDDDTIPGHEWLANCLRCIKQLPPYSLLGTCGIIFPDGTRESARGLGWKHPVDAMVYADIIGHCWFFGRELAQAFCVTHTPPFGPTCGEDYALSALARKRGGIVACPPHPPEKPEMWGSLRPECGMDDVALYRQEGEEAKKHLCHDSLRSNGWKVATEIYRS